MGKVNFMAMAAAGKAHGEGARHLRRAAAKMSVPAMKKIIRRNKQRRSK